MSLEEALKGKGYVRGTKMMYLKKGRYNDHGYNEKIRRDATPSDLIRLWLDGDSGFSCSQYKHWLQCAEKFLISREGKYSLKWHKDLLVIAFRKWLRDNDLV